MVAVVGDLGSDFLVVERAAVEEVARGGEAVGAQGVRRRRQLEEFRRSLSPGVPPVRLDVER